jgi:membrane-bound lytic murein transglycosylase D
MQFLMKSSKLVISVVLSCSLVIAWFGANTEITGDTIQVSELATTLGGDQQKTTSHAKPAVDTVWNSIRSELKLDHRAQSSQVQAEIRKLLADRDKLNSILKAAVPYIYYIHEQTQAYGLPAEIALIPFIESEFNPNDHSNKGATGLWQLMPATASELGVKVKSHYDGRRNVMASTKAALAYFRDLGGMFKGNWYLAIAAYNCGQVRVVKEEKRTGSKSFWNLPLPKETRLYVPKLLAVAEIVKHPEKYGVKLPHVNNQPYFKEVKVTKPVTLSKVAKSSGISVETLTVLNPDYKHDVLPTKGAYSLLVPVDKLPSVQKQLSETLVFS